MARIRKRRIVDDINYGFSEYDCTCAVCWDDAPRGAMLCINACRVCGTQFALCKVCQTTTQPTRGSFYKELDELMLEPRIYDLTCMLHKLCSPNCLVVHMVMPKD